ncbi:hypothetical protein BC832DRAFT_328478 [Gaertneriomyces semiglobifer]|nr:hypothetical protein BC832DRAFT_328478 [Gaertneriomyces semiglobifer]
MAVPATVRAFSQTASAKADLVSDIYVKALRDYKPAKQVEATDLPTTFTAPAPPPKPEVEKVEASATSVKEEAMEEEAWPALTNPIDDPANYPDEWDYTTDHDDGSLFPKRLKPVDYNHH